MAATITTCQHGVEGFCYDDATAEQRAHHAFLFRHAFEYATPAGLDIAEEYATHVANTFWDDDEAGFSHTSVYAAWIASL